MILARAAASNVRFVGRAARGRLGAPRKLNRLWITMYYPCTSDDSRKNVDIPQRYATEAGSRGILPSGTSPSIVALTGRVPPRSLKSLFQFAARNGYRAGNSHRA